MLERSAIALRILCWAMAAFVVYRLVLVIAHINPLYHVTIPALPALAAAPVAGTTGKTTNSDNSTKRGTNSVQQTAASGATNVAPRITNTVSSPMNQVVPATNTLVRTTNTLNSGTNAVAQATNSPARSTNSNSGFAVSPPGLPAGGHGQIHGPGEMSRMIMPGGPMPGGPMPGGPMPGMGKPGPELAPEMQARIDRVIQSEILAPVMRPLPMALLGIAGSDVFLRAPNGQTGLLKEGEELGGVKLLRIGTNRVLVEQQGERKELTIFAGLGGESLLSTQKDTAK